MADRGRIRFVVTVALLVLGTLMPASSLWAQKTYYRSIGGATDYGFMDVDVVRGFPIVKGNGTMWLTANRGRGDRINIAGVDYTILRVEAEDRLILTEPYGQSTGGGKGYLIHRKFPDPILWENCIDGSAPASADCHDVGSGDLVFDKRSEVGIMYAESPFNLGNKIDFKDSTTNSTYMITLTADRGNRHLGYPGTGVVIDRSSGGGAAIEINDGNVTVEWIEIRNGSSEGVDIKNYAPAGPVEVRNLIIHNFNKEGIKIEGDDSRVKIMNNIIYDNNDNGINVTANLNAGALVELFHNTIVNSNKKGVDARSGSSNTVLLHNNVVLDNGASDPDYDVTSPPVNPSSDSNASSDGTAPGLNPLPTESQASVNFVSPGAGNFHIQRPSTAENVGLMLASIVDEDIDESPRPSGSDPDIGADEIGAQPVQVFTAKSSHRKVELEWVTPEVGPYVSTRIVKNTSGVPGNQTDGTIVTCPPVPSLDTRGYCVDNLLINEPIYYAAFVDAGSGVFSARASLEADPFDPTLPERRVWAYSTGATTMEPPAIGSFGSPTRTVHWSSNDKFLHSFEGGGGGGLWPAGSRPYFVGSPAQHRPPVVPVNLSPPDPFPIQLGFVAAQDGYVYAVDVDSGTQVWRSENFGGGALTASVSVVVSAYGAPGYDLVFVGTRIPGGSALHALHIGDGSTAASFTNIPAQLGDSSPIREIGGTAVLYPGGALTKPRVLFTSRSQGAGEHSLWCLEVEDLGGGSFDFKWIWDADVAPGLGVDISPSFAGDTVYVGGRDDQIYAYGLDGTYKWTYNPLPANGPAKGFVFPVFGTGELIFSTDDLVWMIIDNGASASLQPGWPKGEAASPSTPLYIPGTNDIFVGSTDGFLYNFKRSGAAPTPISIHPGSAVGPATFDVQGSLIYVGTSSGIVYSVSYP